MESGNNFVLQDDVAISVQLILARIVGLDGRYHYFVNKMQASPVVIHSFYHIYLPTVLKVVYVMFLYHFSIYQGILHAISLQ